MKPTEILDHAEEILMPLLPDAEVQGDELVARNPRRDDSQRGSFKINLKSGRWADFALDGVKGRSPISFIAYVRDVPQDAARRWAEKRLRELGASGAGGAQTQAPEPDERSEAILPVPAAAANPPLPDRYGYPAHEWRYRDAGGALLFLVRRYDTEQGKEIRAWTYRTPGQWEPRKPPKPWPLLNLDELAKDPSAAVYLAEGEKAATAARKLGGIGTTVLNGCGGVKDADLTPLDGRDVVILPDADEPGRAYAVELTARLQGTVRSLTIVDVWSLGWKDGEDVADHPELTAGWVEEYALPVADWLGGHPQDQERVETRQGVDRIRARVEELAQMDPVEYEVVRTTEAAALGVRISVLDDWVGKRRDDLNPLPDGATGRALALEDPEPWEEPVDGNALALEIRSILHRHLVLPPFAEIPCVLFAFHTWAFDAADFTPHLRFTSPAPQSGKSTGGEIVLSFCRKPQSTVSVSEATLFRLADLAAPTLFVDETDKFLVKNPGVEGLLNASFQRGAHVPRCVGEENEIRMFSVFLPTILAGNKRLAETIEDRSIIIRMKRMTRVEKKGKEKYRYRASRLAREVIRRKLLRWARDNLDQIQAARPRLPEVLDGRAEDIWEPLFQIAEVLGSDWPTWTWQAAEVLSGRKELPQDYGVELLADIRTVVNLAGVEKFTSEWLRYELGALEGRPWSSFTDRSVISQLDLSRALHEYDIRPRKVRIDAKTARRPEQTKETYQGYARAQFEDAWARFLPDGPDDDPPPRGPRSHETRAEDSPQEASPEPGTSGTPGTGGTTTGEEARSQVATFRDVPDVPGVPGFAEASEAEHPVTHTRVPVHYLTDPDQARAALAALVAKGGVLGADTETTGLDPRKDRLRLVQVTDGETVLVIDVGAMGEGAPAALSALADAALVFHNVQFDAGFLGALGVRPRELHCTQLQYAALTHDPMVSLAKACKEVLGVEVPKELQRSDWSAPALSPEQIAYAARDALLVLALHQVLDQRLQAARMVRGFSLVRNCIPAIAEAIARGVLLDRDRHRALVEKWTAERGKALEALQNVLGAGVNPNSPSQLADWLDANLEPATRASWPTTGKGQLATDKDTLEAFADVPLVRPLLEFRRVAHRVKTWGETYQRHVTPDGRIHPGFLLLGARSGRMSCRSPNVQNLPRDPELRACFIAPEGYLLVTADFSQIELRIAGLLSQDPVILSAYQEGKDLHREIVSRVTGKPAGEVTRGERKLGKALNFGLLYGAGPRTFRTRAQVDYGLDLTLEDAERFKDIFDRTYARLRWWQMEQQRQGEQTGKLRTVGGRTISFRDPTHVYTDSRNYPVQAGAADLQLLAIQRVHAALKQTQLPAYLINFVHDELVLEVRVDAVEEVAALLQECMTEAFLDLFKEYPGAESIAAGLVEVGKGPSYAEAK